MEKRRGGGGGKRGNTRDEHSVCTYSHTRAADYYNKSPSALFARPGARYAPLSTRCTRVAFLFTFVVHRAPNAGRATVNGQMAMSNRSLFLSLALFPSFRIGRPWLEGKWKSISAESYVCHRERYERVMVLWVS